MPFRFPPAKATHHRRATEQQSWSAIHKAADDAELPLIHAQNLAAKKWTVPDDWDGTVESLPIAQYVIEYYQQVELALEPIIDDVVNTTIEDIPNSARAFRDPPKPPAIPFTWKLDIAKGAWESYAKDSKVKPEALKETVTNLVGAAAQLQIPPYQLAPLVEQAIYMSPEEAKTRLARANGTTLTKILADFPGITTEEARAQALVQEANKAKVQAQSKARTIARTESIALATSTQMSQWDNLQNKGYLPPKMQVKWIVTPDDRLDEEICAPMQGQIVNKGEDFVTGDGEHISKPPAHPNCRCAIGAVFGQETSYDKKQRIGQADFAARGEINTAPLTRKEKEALGFYTSNGYQQINQSLRNGDPITGALKTKVTNIDNAIDRQEPSTETHFLYRGTTVEGGSSALPKVGESIKDKAFLSTTKSKEFAEMWSKFHYGEPVVYTIKVPVGAKSLKTTGYLASKEQEQLFPRETTLNILSVVEEDTGYGMKLARINAELVPPPEVEPLNKPEEHKIRFIVDDD